MPGGVVTRLLAGANTWAPLCAVRVDTARGSHRLWLKLEMRNPTGSIKYRTALGLLQSLHEERPLVPGSRVVESTSGNLGLAMAEVLGGLGCEFVAVVDPKLPDAMRRRMSDAGAQLITVRDKDSSGGYLRTRLAKVAELMAADPELRWSDQYGHRANPDVHRITTAPELISQTGGRVDAVLIAVSTGGTLAGISEGLWNRAVGAKVLAVDVHGSVVTADEAHPHLLTGIGASRKSSFLRPWHYDRALRVHDVEGFAFCRMLLADTGLALGGSGGALLAAFATRKALGESRFPAAVVADGGTAYESTLYDDGWLAQRGALREVQDVTDRARSRGLSFGLEESSDGL